MRFLYLSLFSLFIFTINISAKRIITLMVPGMSGQIGNQCKECCIGNEFIQLKSLLDYKKIDIGQENCIKHFYKQIEPYLLNQDIEIILYGASQGTAIIINWLSQQHPIIQKKIKAVFLESVLTHGNDAIMHTVESSTPWIKKLPFRHAWGPQLAKLVRFSSYDPHGIQPINTFKTICKDIPIIIMHATTDFQLSFDKAIEFFKALKAHGNDVYFLPVYPEKNRPIHMNIFASLSKTVLDNYYCSIQKILKLYNLPYNKDLEQHPLWHTTDIEEFRNFN